MTGAITPGAEKCFLIGYLSRKFMLDPNKVEKFLEECQFDRDTVMNELEKYRRAQDNIANACFNRLKAAKK